MPASPRSETGPSPGHAPQRGTDPCDGCLALAAGAALEAWVDILPRPASPSRLPRPTFRVLHPAWGPFPERDGRRISTGFSPVSWSFPASPSRARSKAGGPPVGATSPWSGAMTSCGEGTTTSRCRFSKRDAGRPESTIESPKSPRPRASEDGGGRCFGSGHCPRAPSGSRRSARARRRPCGWLADRDAKTPPTATQGATAPPGGAGDASAIGGCGLGSQDGRRALRSSRA
jgi:hypothetical protein